RAVTHLRKSWLSREILMAGLFGASWIVTAGWGWLRNATPSYGPMALLGAGLIYSMSQVYRLRAVPKWNTWRTQAAFFLSAIVLGVLGMKLFTPLLGWVWIAGVALALELGLSLSAQPAYGNLARTLRTIFLGLSALGVILISIFPHQLGGWMVAGVLVLALVQEAIGRWQFYAERVPFPARSN
ncbi:MAG TPA: DmsC/YnfH family molybdoenzyme membrane anchor subunit, partial [Anaerolineales bacterium]|nr:DmsC/YnfH family molybdoenzyme membrane anchor subunit [Anaerolineales bacterium]